MLKYPQNPKNIRTAEHTEENMKRITALILSAIFIIGGTTGISATDNEPVTDPPELTAPEAINGDVTGDSILNSKDLTRLMKFLAGENVDIIRSDINCDGTTNSKDLTRLMKILAGAYDDSANADTEDKEVGGNSQTTIPDASTYILNTSTKKIHIPGCRSEKAIADENRASSDQPLDVLISQGYTKCGNCFDS